MLQTVQEAVPAVVIAQPPKKKNHLVIIDFLRGLAAMMVCLFHFSNGALPKIKHPYIQPLFARGNTGVHIFFVISAFIIPYAMNKSKYKLSDFFSFITKRYIRICPPSYVSVLIVILQWYLISLFFKSSTDLFSTLSFGKIINTLLYTAPFTGHEWINGVFWTLSIEFQFYFFIGLLFPLLTKNFYTYLLGSLLLAASYYVITNGVTLSHFNTLFSIGLAAFMYYDRRITLLQFLLSLALFGVIGFFQVGFYELLLGVGTALAINFVSFSHPVTSFLGKISFSLYLIHVVVGTTVEAVLTKFIPPTSFIACLFILICCISSALLFAYLFSITVEAYFIKLGSKLFKNKA